jgi:hypothetical protein
MRPGILTAIVGLTLSWSGGLGSVVQGQLPQSSQYFPLDHRIPGQAARWVQTMQPRCVAAPQPVRIALPSLGLVTFPQGGPDAGVLQQAPAQVGMVVGQTYRFRISGMPEFPGVELYPTVELIDRLHPPPDLAQQFPIPVQFTEDEIAAALQDQLVTKVVYLEQPQLAVPQDPAEPLRITDLPTQANLLQAADQRGRALAIIRLGGRVPDTTRGWDEEFHRDTTPAVTARPAVTTSLAGMGRATVRKLPEE